MADDLAYSPSATATAREAEELFQAAEQNAKWRLAGYKRLAAQAGEAK